MAIKVFYRGFEAVILKAVTPQTALIQFTQDGKIQQKRVKATSLRPYEVSPRPLYWWISPTGETGKTYAYDSLAVQAGWYGPYTSEDQAHAALAIKSFCGHTS